MHDCSSKGHEISKIVGGCKVFESLSSNKHR